MRLTEPQVYRPEDRSQKQGRDLPVLPPPRRGCSASPSAVRASLVEGWELTQEREAVRQNQAEGGHGGLVLRMPRAFQPHPPFTVPVVSMRLLSRSF